MNENINESKVIEAMIGGSSILAEKLDNLNLISNNIIEIIKLEDKDKLIYTILNAPSPNYNSINFNCVIIGNCLIELIEGVDLKELIDDKIGNVFINYNVINKSRKVVCITPAIIVNKYKYTGCPILINGLTRTVEIDTSINNSVLKQKIANICSCLLVEIFTQLNNIFISDFKFIDYSFICDKHNFTIANDKARFRLSLDKLAFLEIIQKQLNIGKTLRF